MKKIKYLFAIMAVVFLWTACEKEEDKVTLDLTQSVAPAMADLSHLVLTEETALDTLRFVWSAAQYALEDLPDITYRLQYKHVDSTRVYVLTETTGLDFAMTVGALNTRLVNGGFLPETTSDFQFNVVSFIRVEENGTKLTSVPVVVPLSTYEAAVAEAAKLWVPGAYQGWSPATAPNVYSPASDGKYEGYVHFPVETTSLEFKFTSHPDWNNTNYGSGGPGLLDTDPGAGNHTVASVGTWYFTVDTEALTWAGQLRNYALIGTFNGWSGDEPLTWDNVNKVFTVTVNFVAGDKFKWRANAAWDINLGANNPDDGTLVQGGADIVVEDAGNYTVTLNLYAVVPTYTIVKN